MKDIIRCEDMWKVYRVARRQEVTALADITLTIARGSFTLITGPSGSGKTTLLSIIGTIERPTKGRVYIDEKDISRFSESALARLRRQMIGIVFQDYNLIPRLPAWENISYPLIPLGVSTAGRRKKALELLELMGLSHRVNHTPEQLSGGERQRLSIARALINDPEIVLLDEPTSNIDRATAVEILKLLKDLKDRGKTIVVSSHDGELLSESDNIYHLSNGRLVDDT